MFSRTTSVRCVVSTLGGSTTVQPRNIASSLIAGSIQIAGNPKAGSRVCSPGMPGGPPFGSIASSIVGRNSPAPASISLMRIE